MVRMQIIYMNIWQCQYQACDWDVHEYLMQPLNEPICIPLVYLAERILLMQASTMCDGAHIHLRIAASIINAHTCISTRDGGSTSSHPHINIIRVLFVDTLSANVNQVCVYEREKIESIFGKRGSALIWERIRRVACWWGACMQINLKHHQCYGF